MTSLVLKPGTHGVIMPAGIISEDLRRSLKLSYLQSMFTTWLIFVFPLAFKSGLQEAEISP